MSEFCCLVDLNACIKGSIFYNINIVSVTLFMLSKSLKEKECNHFKQPQHADKKKNAECICIIFDVSTCHSTFTGDHKNIKSIF